MTGWRILLDVNKSSPPNGGLFYFRGPKRIRNEVPARTGERETAGMPDQERRRPVGKQQDADDRMANPR